LFIAKFRHGEFFRLDYCNIINLQILPKKLKKVSQLLDIFSTLRYPIKCIRTRRTYQSLFVRLKVYKIPCNKNLCSICSLYATGPQPGDGNRESVPRNFQKLA